jgi:hypothetical protein
VKVSPKSNMAACFAHCMSAAGSNLGIAGTPSMGRRGRQPAEAIGSLHAGLRKLSAMMLLGNTSLVGYCSLITIARENLSL